MRYIILLLLLTQSAYAQQLVYTYPSKEVKKSDIKLNNRFLLHLNDSVNQENLNDFFFVARYHLIESNLDSSALYFDKISKYAFSKDINEAKIASLYFKSKVLTYQNQNNNALKELVKANKLALLTRNFRYFNYIQLGIIELNRKEENYTNAIDLLVHLKHNIFNPPLDTFAVIEYYNRFAAIYNEMATENSPNLDSSIVYSKRAIKLGTQIKSANRLALSYNEIGFSYERKFDYSKATANYKKAADLYKGIEADRNYLNTINNLARVYSKQKQYVKSIKLLEGIAPLLQKYNWEQLNASVLSLKAENFESLKKYDSAVFYYKKSYEYEKEYMRKAYKLELAKDQNNFLKERFKEELAEINIEKDQTQVWNKILFVLLILLIIVLVLALRKLLSIVNNNDELLNANADYVKKNNLLLEENEQKETKIKELTSKLENIMRLIE